MSAIGPEMTGGVSHTFTFNVKCEVLNTSLQWCKMGAYMRNICSKTCPQCVRK